jgi:hypothetical protein
MTIPYRPLGKIDNIVRSTGLEMSYAYDDLVFSDHSVFILRFDDKVTTHLHLYINTECDKKEALLFENQLRNASEIEGLTIETLGSFTINQLEGKNEVEIHFQDSVKSGC